MQKYNFLRVLEPSSLWVKKHTINWNPFGVVLGRASSVKICIYANQTTVAPPPVNKEAAKSSLFHVETFYLFITINA